MLVAVEGKIIKDGRVILSTVYTVMQTEDAGLIYKLSRSIPIISSKIDSLEGV